MPPPPARLPLSASTLQTRCLGGALVPPAGSRRCRGGAGPAAPGVNGDGDDGAGHVDRLVLLVLGSQEASDSFDRGVRVADRGNAIGPDPPQGGPVLVPVLREKADPRVGTNVFKPAELPGAFGLGVYRRPHAVCVDDEGDRHQMRLPRRVEGCKDGDPLPHEQAARLGTLTGRHRRAHPLRVRPR